MMNRILVAVMLMGCGGGAVVSECTKDTDCKGTRVCSSGACVEPGGGSAGSGGTAGAGGTAGSSGAAGGFGGPAGGSQSMGGGDCFGGRDSDCAAGYWCSNDVCVATTKKKVAEQCEQNTDCAGGVCLVRTNSGDIFGYCSKPCASFGECPAFWKCENIQNAAAKYCTQN